MVPDTDSIQAEIVSGQGYVLLMSHVAQCAAVKARTFASQTGIVLFLV
jgi:hypothetical protein